jgi:putative oxygen-independent coproporphyrinogen III oxidase
LKPRPPVALYVHVPFCLSLCPYCDFVVYSGRAARGPQSRVEPFLAAVTAELRLRATLLEGTFGPPGTSARPPLASVYLGGGTPSLLAPAAVAALLELIAARFGLAPDAEITLEANPGPYDLGDLAGFRAAGVVRLSLGAQSLVPAELRRLGRRHGPGDVVAAVAAARAAGIGSLSLDLLYDLPGQTLATWTTTVERALELGPDHLSAYALTLDDPDAEGLTGAGGDHLPVRPGARRWREAAGRAQDPDRAADMYALLDERVATAGLAWYEISNWARPGRQSRHNLAYWRRLPYEAVGPGAHAFDGARLRRWSAARLDAYLAALVPAPSRPPRLPPGGSEVLDEAAVLGEQAVLGLRLAAGLDPVVAAAGPIAPTLAWARAQGLVEARADGHAVLSLRGRLLSNEIFARLV